MVESSGNVSCAMAGASRPRRFQLSLPFLNRKKKRKNRLDNESLGTSRPNHEKAHLSEEGGIGDILQDIEEENEEHENRRDFADESGEEHAAGDHDRRAEHDEEHNLTRALVPKSVTPLDLHRNLCLVDVPMSYKSFDIAYPPGGSPPSRRRTERSSSMKAFDASTRSGSLRTESTSTHISATARRGWLSTKCGFRSCTKQIDMESELRSRDRAAAQQRERHRSHHPRTKASKDPKAWDGDAASEWSVLAEIDNQVGRKKLAPRKRKGYKKSSKLAPSPGIFPPDGVLALTPDRKCSLRDPYEEVREAAKYDLPSQRASSEVENSGISGRSHMLHTLTDGDGNTAEDGDHPWERSFSSSSSDNDELFTTSLEQDGQSKSRRKKWSSNSSDEMEIRRASAGGSHARSKSSWSNHTLRGDLVREHETMENQKSGGKKGSRIIFLSTPPRPKDEEMDEEDEPASTEQLLLKTSSDRFGEYSKLEPVDQMQPRFERTYSMGYKSSLPATSFEADMEATAKAWSKLDVRKNKGDESLSDVSVRELPKVSRLRESGQQRVRQIDVRIEDQLVNLRLESDVSESSEGKVYTSLRGSRRLINKSFSKSVDQEKLPKKKRGPHNRRRRGRKAKAPPPLPSDLHGKVKESVAVVKSSYDPYTDFRDSMVEMIVEKEIQGATDLEELLRCYLSLNSSEYHSVIVKVFADVWRELFADAI